MNHTLVLYSCVLVCSVERHSVPGRQTRCVVTVPGTSALFVTAMAAQEPAPDHKIPVVYSKRHTTMVTLHSSDLSEQLAELYAEQCCNRSVLVKQRTSALILRSYVGCKDFKS